MNRLDKIFRHKLAHHNETVSPDIWEKIATQLPENKRRTRPFFIISATVLIMFLSGIFLVYDGLVPATGESGRSKKEATKREGSGLYALKERREAPACETSSDPVVSVHSENNTRTTRKSIPFISGVDAQKIVPAGVSSEKDLPAAVPVEGIDDNTVEYETNPTQEGLHLLALPDSRVRSSQQAALYPATPWKEKEGKGCPWYFASRNKSVDLYFSHDMGVKTIGSENPALSSHIDMRNATEKARYSFSSGVRFGYNISYRWNLHTGLHYAQINEKFEYTDPESNQTRVITIKDYIYENGIIIDSTITEELVVVPGTTKMRINNRYRSWDIPVLARFTLYANRWMSLSAIGGIYINLTSRQQGMILAPDNKSIIDIAKMESEGTPVFKTQLGVSGAAGISVALHLLPNTDLIIEPHSRIYSSMNTPTNPLNQKFTIAGLNTGLRISF